MSDIICSKEQPIGDKSLLKADSTTTAKTKDLPSFLKMPTPEAVEVFQAAFDNHTDSVPFDGRLVPNQWVLNERSITATVAADFDAQIESLQRENEAQRRLRDEQSEYTIALQRLIEHYCGGKMDKFDREQAPHHYDMLSKAAAITPEMREELSAALAWIEKQIDSGSDVTISRLHKHSTFGSAVVVSVRRGYSSPAKIYGETLVGAISTAANSGLLGEKEYLSGDSIEKQKYLPSDLLGEQG